MQLNIMAISVGVLHLIIVGIIHVSSTDVDIELDNDHDTMQQLKIGLL